MDLLEAAVLILHHVPSGQEKLLRLYADQKERFSNYLRQEIVAVFYFIWGKIIERHRKHDRQRGTSQVTVISQSEL